MLVSPTFHRCPQATVDQPKAESREPGPNTSHRTAVPATQLFESSMHQMPGRTATAAHVAMQKMMRRIHRLHMHQPILACTARDANELSGHLCMVRLHMRPRTLSAAPQNAAQHTSRYCVWCPITAKDVAPHCANFRKQHVFEMHDCGACMYTRRFAGV